MEGKLKRFDEDDPMLQKRLEAALLQALKRQGLIDAEQCRAIRDRLNQSAKGKNGMLMEREANYEAFDRGDPRGAF